VRNAGQNATFLQETGGTTTVNWYMSVFDGTLVTTTMVSDP
jgi:hypothetical protein